MTSGHDRSSGRLFERILHILNERVGLVGAIVLLSVWEVTAHQINYPYLPPVSDILVALGDMLLSGAIFRALTATLIALWIGLAFAIVIGTAVGAAMGLSKTMRFALSPYVDALMSAPMTAFVPLFMLLFGLGIETRIIVVFLFAFFPIAINAQAGMMAARADLIEMAQSFDATPRQTFFKVRLPMSYPHLRAGLRMAMARGVDGIVTGEVLIAAVGIGGLVTQYGRSFSADRLFAIVVVIVTLSFCAVWLVDRLGRILFGNHGR